jgi:thiosulfate/3-mercaptopyruvate sulfurtransferase
MPATEVLTEVIEKGYAHPETLVTTEWVQDHLDDKLVRIVESNEDQLLYSTAHIPGAIQIDWIKDLNDPVKRDYLDKKGFENLMSRNGISNDTKVVFYGDKNNWWACYAFWVFKLFGIKNAAIMDGGRIKWEKENRSLTRDLPKYPVTKYNALERNDQKIRAFREHVLEHVKKRLPLVDVRSQEEYTGERLHMPNYPNEGALRGGHIPGAANIPWSIAANPENGTFKAAEELRKIYVVKHNLEYNQDIITYCRIGERSSHTWYVLTYLLGYNNVRNYDGSWTEWGNLVGVPIDK